MIKKDELVVGKYYKLLDVGNSPWAKAYYGEVFKCISIEPDSDGNEEAEFEHVLTPGFPQGMYLTQGWVHWLSKARKPYTRRKAIEPKSMCPSEPLKRSQEELDLKDVYINELQVEHDQWEEYCNTKDNRIEVLEETLRKARYILEDIY